MAKTHWMHEQGHGCQHSTCDNPAFFQWQRSATEDEIAADRATVGQYGAAVRNETGPHTTAVFACVEHIPTVPAEDPTQPDVPDLDWLAKRHGQTCPAPDGGCECG